MPTRQMAAKKQNMQYFVVPIMTTLQSAMGIEIDTAFIIFFFL